jgi:para-nitrobenzyl esterase
VVRPIGKKAVSETFVDTPSGRLRGLSRDGVRTFLSVPYAASPVGPRRFRAPEPPESWSGVRDATVAAATAPQSTRPFPNLDVVPLIGRGWQRGDDFLSLNVWAPDATQGPRPVMVFIHGGGFVLGSKDAAVNDGAGFARSGVVCVGVNYRLGVEGFLPIDGAPTNLGLRDQLAALSWVRDHVAAFGGDPANITVFGESAGAMSIANLVASPLGRGLFTRAIIQSGHGSMVRHVDVAKRLTRRIARYLRTTPDVEGFRARTPEQCVAALEKAQSPARRIDLRDQRGRDPSYGLTRFLPVYGDDVLPEHPLEALAHGVGADVDVLIGTNREEMNLYFVPTGVRRKMPGLLARLLLRRSEPRAVALLKAYGFGARGRRPGDVFTEALHDAVFRWPARRFAAAHRGRTYVYEFDWRSPACEGELGACHGLELPFVFDTLATVTGPNGVVGTAPPQALAGRVHALWVRFATDGTLPWGEYDATSSCVYELEHGRTIHEPDMPAAAVLS